MVFAAAKAQERWEETTNATCFFQPRSPKKRRPFPSRAAAVNFLVIRDS
jgi:hypothetical protein